MTTNLYHDSRYWFDICSLQFNVLIIVQRAGYVMLCLLSRWTRWRESSESWNETSVTIWCHSFSFRISKCYVWPLESERMLKNTTALAWGIHTRETPSASHSLLFATAAGSSCANTPERLGFSTEGGVGGVRVTEQLGTAHPKFRKAERMHDACCRCGSESGEGKRGENREVGTYGKVKGQSRARRWRAAGWRVNAKVKFWLSYLLS